MPFKQIALFTTLLHLCQANIIKQICLYFVAVCDLGANAGAHVQA